MTRAAACLDEAPDGMDAAPLAAVRESWCEALGRPCDDRLTWEASGGDSLATLHLLLGLERRTGRKLSFDEIQPEKRPGDLARVLAADRPDKASAAGDGLTTVYLFPGLFGDEPLLAALRRSLSGVLRFELIDHPEVTAPRAIHVDLPRMGQAAAQEIARRHGSGAIFLAGYSFGGCVAFEAARRLAGEGREIGLLAILDAATDATPPSYLERPRRMLLRAIGRFDAGRRLAMRLIERAVPVWANAARRRFVQNMRVHALRCWRPAPLEVGAFLAVSDEFLGRIVEPWQRLCPGIGVVHIRARHGRLFAPEALEVLTPALMEAITASVRMSSTRAAANGNATRSRSTSRRPPSAPSG